jgi:hypothetical protein
MTGRLSRTFEDELWVLDDGALLRLEDLRKRLALSLLRWTTLTLGSHLLGIRQDS